MGLRRPRTTAEKRTNPFLLPPPEVEEEEVLEDDQILGGKTSFTNALPADSSKAALWPVGGGVGVSTLVEASGGALTEPDDPRAENGPVIAVATTAADRMEVARQLLEAKSTETGRSVAGLVLVHDRPKLSKETVREAKRVVRMADRSWIIPWLGYLREPGENPTKHPLRFRRVIAELTKATQ